MKKYLKHKHTNKVYTKKSRKRGLKSKKKMDIRSTHKVNYQKGSGFYFDGRKIVSKYLYYYTHSMTYEYNRLTHYLLNEYNKNRHKYIELPFVKYIHKMFETKSLSYYEICSLVKAFTMFQENPIPNTMEFLVYAIDTCRYRK